VEIRGDRDSSKSKGGTATARDPARTQPTSSSPCSA
jgi:hypothetical protein